MSDKRKKKFFSQKRFGNAIIFHSLLIQYGTIYKRVVKLFEMQEAEEGDMEKVAGSLKYFLDELDELRVQMKYQLSFGGLEEEEVKNETLC